MVVVYPSCLTVVPGPDMYCSDGPYAAPPAPGSSCRLFGRRKSRDVTHGADLGRLPSPSSSSGIQALLLLPGFCCCRRLPFSCCYLSPCAGFICQDSIIFTQAMVA